MSVEASVGASVGASAGPWGLLGGSLGVPGGPLGLPRGFSWFIYLLRSWVNPGHLENSMMGTCQERNGLTRLDVQTIRLVIVWGDGEKCSEMQCCFDLKIIHQNNSWNKVRIYFSIGLCISYITCG